jgi:aminotransferase
MRRDRMATLLERHGFRVYRPSGAYYVMTDISGFGGGDDVQFARELVMSAGVAAVPGSSFYREPVRGRTKLRFCFSYRDESLSEADRGLEEWAARRTGRTG